MKVVACCTSNSLYQSLHPYAVNTRLLSSLFRLIKLPNWTSIIQQGGDLHKGGQLSSSFSQEPVNDDLKVDKNGNNKTAFYKCNKWWMCLQRLNGLKDWTMNIEGKSFYKRLGRETNFTKNLMFVKYIFFQES